ncbi:MAG TPA: amino acid adenylation domain-containing protein, partial [Thermoanaerobaculia bacterium]|nr:amino acid adenylation domain-containing protein [Thermoanaerobaculia bacterium]
RALPEPDRQVAVEALAAARTPTEELLAGSWAERLGLERVGVTERFFDLGGHSLLATRAVSRVRELFGVELPLREFFERSTVAGVAAEIERAISLGLSLEAPPLRKLERNETRLPLSFAQERLWFLDQLEPGSSYNVPAAVRLTGRLDVAALAGSLSGIVRRHESLRTTFARSASGEPVQVIAPTLDLDLPLVDLSDLSRDSREAIALRLAAEEMDRPFDLGRGPLFRVSLLRLAEEHHLMLLSLHHIVSDGWSMGILIRELAAMYGAALEGRTPALPDLPVQYADFALWQRGWLRDEALERRLAWWREHLAGAPMVLDLPTDRPRPAVQSYRGGSVPLRLPAELTAALGDLGRRGGATLFMTLLTGFAALLARYTGQRDLLLGSPIANRNRIETEGLIGFFVNTLVLRGELSGRPGFGELLGRVRASTLGAYAHQDLPFEKLVAEFQTERDLSRSPLFQVMLVLQNAPDAPLELPGLTLETVGVESRWAKFDLLLTLLEGRGKDEGISGSLAYSLDLFDRPTAERLLGHFRSLLQGAAADPGRPFHDLPLLTRAERWQLMEWNATEAPYRSDLCLHGLFEAQAARSPQALALVFEDQSLTYAALAGRVGRLADHLRSLGVGPEVVVGICAERSIEMVVGLLAILGAGGAYLPLDPSYPAERLAFMLEEARVPILLAQDRLLPLLPAHAARVVSLDREQPPSPEAHRGAPSTEPRPAGAEAGPDNLAYVIFTSGSTGRPKGVMNTHRGIVNRLLWMQEAYGLGSGDRVLQKTPFSFDVSVWELFWPLLTGARLVMAVPGGHQDGAYLVRTIAAQGITTIHFVPSMLRAFLDEPDVERCTSIKRVIASGEALPFQLERRFFSRLGAELHNLYGPTEAAVDVTYWACQRDDAHGLVPIGHPVANTEIHLLDTEGHEVPVGVPGELHIGGVQLARGYLARPALTAERFVPDGVSGRPGLRLYRTGDLARRLPDGAVDYLGRIDHQVKVRGFRIELGEIEAVLTAHPQVSEAVVVAREDRPGDQRLVAYVVAPRELFAELRAQLKSRLPEYMIPSLFVSLDSLPLSPNGKVDRRALPAPERAAAGEAGVAYVAPRTPAEELLAGIWTDVLGADPESIGAHANFFELGGHSLLATQVVSRIRQAFGVELPLRRLFEVPTLSALAAAVETSRSEPGPRIAPISPRVLGELPLSFAQERLWFLDQLQSGQGAYNLPYFVRIEGRLETAVLERALAEVARRHQVLRSSYPDRGGRPVLHIDPELVPRLCRVDLRALPAESRGQSVDSLALAESRRPFDLQRGPLMRAQLLTVADTEHFLLFSMHHIVSDGWSRGVLLRETVALYDAFLEGRLSPLPELELQYVDFAAWQREWLRGEVLDRYLAVWRRRMAGAPSQLDLPTDRPRPALSTFRGSAERTSLPAQVGDRLKGLARREGGTPFMVLLAAFQALLYRYTGQEKIPVGSPIANRNRAEIEGLIGFFVNTLVLATDLAGDPEGRELLARVREVALEAYAHQDLPFDKLVAELEPERNLGSTPLFQVVLVLQNAPQPPLELPALRLAPVEVYGGVAKFDLTLAFEESDGTFHAFLEYNRDLFEAATARRLLGHFERLLDGLVADPARRISDLELLTASELEQLLAWNRAGAAAGGSECLHRLFEVQAALRPEAVAVVCGDEALTYGELAGEARRLAAALRARGVGPESRVGLCAERSVELVVGLLGILGAGGSYVPLDPAYPQERLAYILGDAGISVLLTQSGLAAKLAGCGAELLLL